MNKFVDMIQPDNGQPAIPIQLLDAERFETWLKEQAENIRALVKAQKFSGKDQELIILPGDKPSVWGVALGVKSFGTLGCWSLAKAADTLPEGVYRLVDHAPCDAALGWLLGQYRFEDYLSEKTSIGARILLTNEPGKIPGIVMQAQGTAMVRDLVNRPAADLGPAQLLSEAEAIAIEHKAKLTTTKGDALAIGFPLVDAVGKAAARGFEPRMIEIEWGDTRHPRIAIVGKGITFDSGGLDIKSSSGMRIMKKDMGGAAHAMALASMIMKANLPVRLHMLVAAAENCISGNALRPGDIIKSRAGITVEIDNTDAEGRLVLADALTKACEDKPELIINFATLTGAARVALGPDLPALFANDDDMAAGLIDAGIACSDPVWRLPLWAPYDEMLASDIADTANSGGAFAGAVTGALFLQKFVSSDIRWAHFDTYAWRPASKSGRPKGGEALGLRASFRYLSEKYPARSA
jgi:leucyl aminopeptidase